MKFCPICHYYLYLNSDNQELRRLCRNCGHEEKDTEGGLIMETNLHEQTSEGYKILINEFTKQDPTLPHVDSIKCPNATCKSNTSEGGVQRDVIYIKYDAVNLKFLYMCNVCDTQWKSKS